MNNPIGYLQIWGAEKQNKAPTRLNGVQIGEYQSVPQNISTPFPKNRYQILAFFWERCHCFCQYSSLFFLKLEKIEFFYVLHNAFTAVAYRIRAPPSEV